MKQEKYEINIVAAYAACSGIAQSSFKGKVDLNGKPYIDHIWAVLDNLNSDDLELRMVAMLHDLVEDCPEWNTDKLTFLPKRVQDGIKALTKIPGEGYIKEYIDRVCRNEDAMLVKIADLKHNMDITRFERELTEYDILRLKKYHKSYLKITNELATRKNQKM